MRLRGIGSGAAVMQRDSRAAGIAALALWTAALGSANAAEPAPQNDAALQVRQRTRVETAPESGLYREVTTPHSLDPQRTAIVICDMWNDHYCRNAARRVAEMAPRMNEVIKAARERGVLIIHSPSGCMDKYEGTPQRKLAQSAPPVKTKVALQTWCYLDEKHEPPMPVAVGQPCDDDGSIRAAVRHFDRQIDTLEIAAGDAVTDSAEAFYLIKQRGIKHIIIMGVHTNMCVLGRPFGIRQMVYQGQQVLLMRDMTDTMYNPRDEPYVNHFTGNDLVFEHIERHWCPTITSADFLGGQPFRFPGDKRKHVVLVLAEQGYDTAKTLPPFALQHLGPDFKLSCVYADPQRPHEIPGLEALDDADLAIWSIRRRALAASQLAVVRRFLAAGKPLVAIRTTSHAFCLSEGADRPQQSGLEEWPEFDREVLGAHYQGDHQNKSPTRVRIAEGVGGHPILFGFGDGELDVFSSLYKHHPLHTTAAALLLGRAEGLEQEEPVAWTRQRPRGGKVFYTTLGHSKDFALPAFRRLLRNAVYWAADLPIPATLAP